MGLGFTRTGILHYRWENLYEHINLLETRVDQLEHVVNQLENFILCPGGHVSETLTRTSLPASGQYYHNSPIYYLASGVNSIVEAMLTQGLVTEGQIPWYPFNVGVIE
jgi:hypothetical protein